MKKVVIYTSNTWPHCFTAKDYLSEKGIDYVEKNIQTDPTARKELMQKGLMGVPVIIVDGEEMVGFNKVRLDELL